MLPGVRSARPPPPGTTTLALVTTDPDASPAEAIQRYADGWSLEVAIEERSRSSAQGSPATAPPARSRAPSRSRTRVTCGDGNEATFKATDTPLTDITATATSEAPGGTQSTITCVGPSPATTNVGNPPQGPAGSPAVSAKGLKPGTYTCTIVVDP